MSRLTYYPFDGYGELIPDEPFAYGQAYFDNFKRLGDTPTGKLLNRKRATFVQSHYGGVVIDVGVGDGAFMRSMGYRHCMGYDVPGPSREMLLAEKLFRDPYDVPVDAITCWDSLEHMLPDQANQLIENVKRLVFVSIPIFETGDAICESHHYKPGEHILYFTERGLIGWMFDRCFKLLEKNRMEEAYGRSGIGTYVFYRCN